MIEVSTVRRRLIGGELRRLRQSADFSLDDAARILECDRSKISRIETGHRGIRPKELRELLAEYGVAEKRRYALANLARQTGKRGWWQKYGNVLTESRQELISLEEDAATEWSFALQFIPDLLQTEAYIRSIAETSRTEDLPQNLEHLVAACIMRQYVLIRDTAPLRLWAILSEAALRQMVGGPDVMHNQLRYLIDIQTKLPNVTIQVLPFDSSTHIGTSGPFTGLSFPEPADLGVVHIDDLTGSSYLEAPEHVQQHRRAFEKLVTCALPAEPSMTLIEKAIAQLRSPDHDDLIRCRI